MNAADADALLVERAAGDRRAFEMLVVKYQRRIERLIGRMVRDVDLVEDIARRHSSAPTGAAAVPRRQRFYTWLYRIAVNTAKKALVDLKRDPVITESRGAARDDDDETSGRRKRTTDAETPRRPTPCASKEIAAAVNAAIEALSGICARPSRCARSRAELRRDRRS